MTIKPIKSKEDYENTLKRLEIIFDFEKGTSKGDELEILEISI